MFKQFFAKDKIEEQNLLSGSQDENGDEGSDEQEEDEATQEGGGVVNMFKSKVNVMLDDEDYTTNKSGQINAEAAAKNKNQAVEEEEEVKAFLNIKFVNRFKFDPVTTESKCTLSRATRFNPRMKLMGLRLIRLLKSR